MSTPTVHHHSAIPAYSGPHEIPGIAFRPARSALGVQAWGMNVIQLDPHCTGYPTHNHDHDGQEEVYVVLEGAVNLHLGDTILPMSTGDMVRVSPEQTRQLVTTDSAASVLAIGGTPGVVYSPGPGM